MANAGILHRIYTNAAEDGAWESARGRVVALDQRDASRSLTPDVLSALDDLLRKTSPASTRTGWVVCRFVDGGQTYACAIASYPDLVNAADGREGVLNHARLVRADGPSFDVAALIEAADAFPLADVCAVPSGQRLRAYLDEVSNESSIVVRPVEMSELQKVPRDVISGVLLACLATLGRRERVSMAIADARPSIVARAWAALPFAAQRTSAWAAGVSESCPADVLFSSSQGKSPAQMSSRTLVECVTQYVRLLHEAPQTVAAMLVNSALKDASALANAVQRSALAPELSSVSGREEMPKKERATKPDSREPRSDWQPLAPDVQSELSRQLKAMEEVLRREMDDRLTTFEAKMRSQSPSRPQPSPILASLLPLWITLGVLVLAALGWFGYRTFASRPMTPPVTSQESRREQDVRDEVRDDEPEPPAPRDVPAMTPPQAAVARAAVSEKWAEELKKLLEDDAMFVANAVSAVARREEVPRTANAALASFASRIARNEDLQASGREKLRALLIECLAADVDGAAVKIDGKLDDVAPHIDALRSRYRVTNQSSDATQMSLQSEILLRWLAELER